MADKDQSRDCSLTESWIFSIAGALVAIPIGIRRKSLAPLVFFGSTGAMLDIIMSVTQCEREFHERQQRKLLERQAEVETESEVA